MSERNHKSMSVPREVADKLEKIAEIHGVKASVVLAALVEVADIADSLVEPFILRSKELNDQMRSRVASERAKTTHARRKALQVQNDGVE